MFITSLLLLNSGESELEAKNIARQKKSNISINFHFKVINGIQGSNSIIKHTVVLIYIQKHLKINKALFLKGGK